jgi:hypothetical protein
MYTSAAERSGLKYTSLKKLIPGKPLNLCLLALLGLMEVRDVRNSCISAGVSRM